MSKPPRKKLKIVEPVIVSLIVYGVYAGWTSGVISCGPQLREGAARTVVMQLSAVCDMYQVDWAVYPPGTGSGSRNLAAVLSREGGKVCAYMRFPPESLTLQDGHVANPLWPEEGWPLGAVHYRAPGLHNPGGVDLWCADLSGRWDGINNWE